MCKAEKDWSPRVEGEVEDEGRVVGKAWETRGGGGDALGQLQPGIHLGTRLGTPVAQLSLYVRCLK